MHTLPGFYQSRYYDAELGRFTQADTIVPSTNTSQALNRYAYVKNNPLKFTDPDGHGFFSKIWKKIKGFIGTIVQAALTVIAPWGAALWAVVGAAVGAAVNGGTWKSFAIGAAIGFAAGAIAGAMGFSPPDTTAAGFQWTTEKILQATVAGAVTGAVAGAISSAVYGGNWGNNIGAGAMGGAMGGAIAGITGAVTGKLKAWVKGTSATQQLLAAGPYGSGDPFAMGDPTFNQGNPDFWGNVPKPPLFIPNPNLVKDGSFDPANMWHWEINPQRVGHGKIVMLTDTDIAREIKWYTEYMISQQTSYSSVTQGTLGDTRFKILGRQWHKFTYDNKIYNNTEVNYLGVGASAAYWHPRVGGAWNFGATYLYNGLLHPFTPHWKFRGKYYWGNVGVSRFPQKNN